MAKQSAAIRILFGADTRQFDKALKDSLRKMQKTAADLKSVGSGLSKSLTAPLLGIAAISAKTAADFEFAMAKVQAVSGFTAGEMSKLTQQAEDLGASTSKTQDEVAALQLELAKLGKTSGEIENMTESVLSLGIAFDQELGESARIIGATLNQFELDASEAGRVADNMAILFGQSALDLQKFDAAMRVIGPTANALELSVEQVGSAMAILSNSGVEASTVGTALTKALTTLAKEGLSGEEALSKLLTGQLDVAQAFEFFGDRAGKIVPILQRGKASYESLTEAQINGAGAATRARKVLEETSKGGLDKLKSAASAAATTIGKKLLPTINKIVDFATKVLSKFAKLSPATLGIGIAFATVAASIGPVIFLSGQFIFSLAQLKIALNSATAAQIKQNLAVLANPYVAAAAAVALLAGGLYILSKRQRDVVTTEEKLNKVQAKAEESVKDEVTAVNRLTAEYKLAGDSLKKRRKVLRELNRIAPDTFGNLDAEKTGYEDLKTAVDGYTKSIMQKAVVKAFENQLVDAQAQLINTQQSIEDLITELNGQTIDITIDGETVSIPTNVDTGLDPAAQAAKERELQYLIDELRKRESTTTGEIQDIQRRMAATIARGGVSIGDIFGDDSGEGGSETVREDIEKIIPLADELTLAFLRYNAALDAQKPKQKTMVETLDEMTAAIQEGKELIPAFQSSLIQFGNTGLTVGQQLARVFGNLREIISDTMDDIGKRAEFIGNTIGNAFEQAFLASAESTETLGEALKRTGKEALGIILAEIVGLAIKNAFQTAGATGPMALVLAPALAGAAAGAAKSLFSSSVPKFAKGGMVTGPTMSLLGDNPSGKEMVIPFERMGEFLGKFSSGNQNVNVQGRVAGRDLVLVQERGIRNQTRIR